MHVSRALAGACVALLLLEGSAACRSGSTISNRLEEILSGVGQRGGGKTVSRDEIRAALTHQLREAPVPEKGRPRPSSPAFPTRQTLLDFYAARGQKLAWIRASGQPLPAAGLLIKTLRKAGEHGLDPDDYSVDGLLKMRDRLRAPRGGEPDVTRWADFDLLLTTAFFRYASDLSTGRVHPNEIRSEWLTEPPELDLPGALGRALEDGKLEPLLEGLPPPHPGYDRLRAALADLQKVAAAGGWKPIPAGPALKTGSRGTRVALLRERLGAGGAGRAETKADARPASTRGTGSTPRRGTGSKGSGGGAVFDARLAEAVRAFQARHGLEPDGIVARATIAALNVPVERRIRQVELNLERWRWIPRRLGALHVEVNIPGFELTLVQDGRTALRSRIVAGTAYTPTPVFTDRIVAVVANPPWNVPRELAVREYLPELREDPALFEKHGIRIFEEQKETKKGKTPGEEEVEVDPKSVSWGRVADDEFDYRLRQDPGPDNALGRVKFQLTNDFQIYLHDTPARNLFAEARRRDFSHGCIRVEQARALADRLLGESASTLEEALGSEQEKAIPIRPAVPIQILYLTAWVDEDKTLRFGPDVYDFDAPQQAALDRIARTAKSPPRSQDGGQTPSKKS